MSVTKLTKVVTYSASKYLKYLSLFPQSLTYCFAYGSGVLKQTGPNSKLKKMIDFIFVVQDSASWHRQNINWNPSHYSGLSWLGPKFVANFQEHWGAKVYFNTLVPVDRGEVLIKYGVISRNDLVTDLLDWCHLYIAGRLHKPVEVVRQTSDSQLRLALQQNLHSAVHAALLQLPESFAEIDLYQMIASLSYGGDFRMMFGEDKNKVNNIVQPQMEAFRALYMPVFKSLHDYLDIPTISGVWWQNNSPQAKIYHLNQLPRVPQQAVVRAWNKDKPKHRFDTEDSLYALGHDLDCAQIVGNCLRDIVWASSVRQSFKGIFTAGLFKSVRYSSQKIIKMMKSRKKTKKSL